MSKFFTFRQNNSGGSFDFDKESGITFCVIVEAKDADEANKRAEEIGLYFNGVDMNMDCECCGDRWHEVWGDDEGDDVPSMYGEPIVEGGKNYDYVWTNEPNSEIAVHYKDGTIKWY